MDNQRAFSQIRWIAIGLALFFTLSAIAQFFFIKGQVDQSLVTRLSNAASELSTDITYTTNSQIDIAAYDKIAATSNNYFAILNDGYLFDMGGAIPPGFLPKVQFVGDETPYIQHVGSYTSPLGNWTLLTKPLVGGRIIIGILSFDTPADPAGAILGAAQSFTGNVADAARVPLDTLDTAVISYAVLDDTGTLLAGYGRLPLRTNAYTLGNLGLGAQEKVFGGDTYALWSQTFHNDAGTLITFENIAFETTILNNQRNFNIVVSLISWLALFLFGYVYWNKKETEKVKLRETFRNYFSPQILDVIMKNPEKLKLGGERREVTILFSDIRSFTSLTETLPPQVLTDMLHEYFSEMTEEVLATDGILDKYIGDAIMAFWGAPVAQTDQADRAVTTALNMMRRLKKLQEKWEKEGRPKLDIGIGINLGVATVGNFGSEKRFDYTIIGDAVNAASRIEGLNKEYKSHIIISESTKNHLTLKVRTEDLGEVLVKGKEKPIRIFKVLDEE